MPSDKNNPGDTNELPTIELSGRFLRRRQHQTDTHDPYETSRSFEGLRPPIKLFRRPRSFKDRKAPPEPEKRVKFEILDESKAAKRSKGGGYDPYDTSD